jgi:hypothetical protein
MFRFKDYNYNKREDIWYDSEGFAVNLEDIYGEREDDDESDDD